MLRDTCLHLSTIGVRTCDASVSVFIHTNRYYFMCGQSLFYRKDGMFISEEGQSCGCSEMCYGVVSLKFIC